MKRAYLHSWDSCRAPPYSLHMRPWKLNLQSHWPVSWSHDSPSDPYESQLQAANRTNRLTLSICDVISEKRPYCGENSVFLDQLFLHFCDSIFYQNCAGSEKNVSFRCSLATNIVGPDQTPRIMRGVCSGPMIFVPQ